MLAGMSDVFIVDRLLKARTRKKKRYVLVKWKNYGGVHNSWEPCCNISDELLQAFDRAQQPPTPEKKTLIPRSNMFMPAAAHNEEAGTITCTPAKKVLAAAITTAAPSLIARPVQELSVYDKQRQERIRENNAMLAHLGITEAAKQLNSWVAKPASLCHFKRKRNMSVGTSEPRRSGRQRNAVVIGLDFAQLDRQLVEATGQLAAGKKKRKTTFQASRIVRPELSEEQLQKMGDLDLNWLQGLEDFLNDEILHTYWFGRAASETNIMRVMAQVRKLASGHGVPHPSSSAVFMQGRPLTLSSNIRALVEEAWEWLYTFGEDKGHGWLLNHPLKKALAYQQHMVDKQAVGGGTDETR